MNIYFENDSKESREINEALYLKIIYEQEQIIARKNNTNNMLLYAMLFGISMFISYWCASNGNSGVAVAFIIVSLVEICLVVHCFIREIVYWFRAHKKRLKQKAEQKRFIENE